MRKYYNRFFDETYYIEKLNNGLRVIIFHKPDFSTTVAGFGTPYGALKINEKVNNKVYHFNPGIAHFLEHKLFEAKTDDMMNAFSSMGANVNAFTSYRETVYYFSKSGKDIEEPLNLLLDFVQELNISENSVEKEKGIIIQELEMYKQIPDQRILNETYKCLYHNFPIKYDIGGDSDTVNAITKQELEQCYKINYHPSNMVLCITTPLDPNYLIRIIRDNQNKKSFAPISKIISADKKEPKSVVKKRYTFKMPINIDKHVLAIKVHPDFKDDKDAFKKEWSLRILLEAYFSSLNPDYQEWLDKNIIDDFFGYEIEFNMDCANILFFIENDDDKVLPSLVEKTLKKDLINKDIVEQLKRRYIATMFEMFNDVEGFNLGYIRDYMSNIDIFEMLTILKRITLKDVKNARVYLSCPHKTYVSMIKR